MFEIEIASDLPENATHGFRLISGDHVLFFWWNDQGEHDGRTTHGYDEVLKALPQRIAELGIEDENAILGEVIGRFGAG